MRRVVVTGLGIVSPLGCGVPQVWERLIQGKSGLRGIQSFDVSDLPCKVAGQVPHGETSEGYFNPDDWMLPKDQRKVDPFIIYAMVAAGAGDRGFRLEARGRGGARAHRRHDRLRHRRAPEHLRRLDHACMSAGRGA